MCNSTNCSHDDDLDDAIPFLGEFVGEYETRPAEAVAIVQRRAIPVPAQHVEKCPSCHGRGRFISYAGRDCGPCFKCKGKGELVFKQSADVRAANRESAAARKERKLAEWIAEHAAEHAWIAAKAPTFEFAAAMAESLTKYGSLTENQLATVRRLCARDIARDEERKAERERREVTAPVVSAVLIEQAFAHAQDKGVKKPKMILNGFKFSMAPAHGANAGALYVVRVSDDQYLGKIKEGRFNAVRECSDAERDQVAAVVNDPKGEAIAYGQRTGNCCICNRELTNHASIDAGIGPICAGRFGW